MHIFNYAFAVAQEKIKQWVDENHPTKDAAETLTRILQELRNQVESDHGAELELISGKE